MHMLSGHASCSRPFEKEKNETMCTKRQVQYSERLHTDECEGSAAADRGLCADTSEYREHRALWERKLKVGQEQPHDRIKKNQIKT